jgi:hypothetical protein
MPLKPLPQQLPCGAVVLLQKLQHRYEHALLALVAQKKLGQLSLAQPTITGFSRRLNNYTEQLHNVTDIKAK